MENAYELIIDAFAHISPPKYTDRLRKNHCGFYNNILGRCPPLFDMEYRFRIMDQYPNVMQVLTIGPVPSLEYFADPKVAAELAQMANDEMAELLEKHRHRFASAIALLPMNNIDAAINETDRAIVDLGFKGVYVHSNINGKPLDDPEFLPLFEKMAQYNLPIYIHPWRSDDYSEYPSEDKSKYAIASTFGWPYETTVAMSRIIFSGICQKFPNLKIVTHHCGGMVPYYAQRIVQHYGEKERRGESYVRKLSRTPLEYYKMFYADTAIHGNTPALMLACDFFGVERIVLGADFPLGDYYFGVRSYRQTIRAIKEMNISDEQRQMILSGNALKLLRLSI